MFENLSSPLNCTSEDCEKQSLQLQKQKELKLKNQRYLTKIKRAVTTMSVVAPLLNLFHSLPSYITFSFCLQFFSPDTEDWGIFVINPINFIGFVLLDDMLKDE